MYINDPDGNLIELVYHPLGIDESSRWTQIPGFVNAEYDAARTPSPASAS